MAATTAVHSNAFNFLSFFEFGVDPRTGQYTLGLTLPEVKCNDLSGPVLPISLSFNPLNTLNSGFGLGWEVRLSQYDPGTQVLSLSTGETFKVTGMVGNRLEMQEQKIKSFYFYEDAPQLYRVVHKSGMIEMLRSEGGLALPETIYSAEGHKVSVAYLPYGSGQRRLHTVRDGQGVVVVQVNLPAPGQDEIQILLRPDGSPGGALAKFVLKLRNSGPGDEVYEVILPTEDQARWRFKYETKNNLHCITEVWTPVGGHETIEYDATGHGLPGDAGRSLPRVSKHISDPGFEQPALEVRYSYDNSNLPGSNHNFVANGSSITWTHDGLDNLYKVTDRYQYGTTETHYAEGVAVRSIERTFNRFHLLTEEKTTQGSKVHQVFTTYYADDNLDLPFSSQNPQCQLAKSVETRWSEKGTSRSETVLTTYDTHGNLTEQVQANGTKESYSYFPIAGITGECPPDPTGFVRSLRETTVTPAPGHDAGAPVLRTRNRYALMPPVKGTAQDASSDWLVLTEEALFQVNGTQEQPLQLSAYKTLNDDTDALRHGRRTQQTITLNDQTTTTDYAYEKLNSTFVGETVLQTIETLTGFDHGVDGKHTQKIITREDSLLHGQPLLTYDDNDVQIRYQYDVLQRVVSETVAPDDPLYKAERIYHYFLTNADKQQAWQIATDVKGMQTKSLFDGLNRVIQEQRQDTDNRSGARADEFRDTYIGRYNALGQLAEETEYDWCSAEAKDDFVLTSRYTYDDWGEQSSVTRPDGVVEHEVTDPIALTISTWLEGMGKTVTQNNLFEKPDWVKRYALGDDPNAPGIEPLSEHHYRYDGLGRSTLEIDALNHRTRYVYDAFDRMIESILPDEAVVERRYALHSTEDLPIWIGVNAKELGQQQFDGLDRMYTSITGGRVTEYQFIPGQTQPFKVTRPDAQVVDYVYKPALGEEPLERTTQTGLKATYVYDGQNARLKSCTENGLTLSREYYSNGEVKSETREGHTMFYHYSRQARLLAYTDVLEQIQRYDYDKSNGQLKSTTLGTTVATFTYNAQGQTETIETRDGAQTLKVKLTYDDLGREVLREFDFGTAPAQTLTQVYNEVDGLVERILEEKETGTLLRHEIYGYDVRGRLELYECSGTQPPVDPYGKPIEMQLFMFDELDNLTLVKTYFADGSNTAEYAYENQADPAQLTRVTNDHEDYLPKVIALTYNLNGELTRDEEGRALDYDVHGRLITVSGLSGEPPRSNRYDPLDTLASQHDESRFYQDGQLHNLREGSNSSTFMRGNGDVLAELKAGADPKSLLLASDDKNSVLCEVSRDDRQEIAYSPYGHSEGGTGSLGYNGELREAQVGWYLLGNGYRAYNPLLKRFHSSDSWSPFGRGGLNAYMYVLGNPVGFTDETGHSIRAIRDFFRAGYRLIFKWGTKGAKGTKGTKGAKGAGRNAPVSTTANDTNSANNWTTTTLNGRKQFTPQLGIATPVNGSRFAGPGTRNTRNTYLPKSNLPEELPTKSIKKVPRAQQPVPKPVSEKTYRRMGYFDQRKYEEAGGIVPNIRGAGSAKPHNFFDLRQQRDQY